MQISTEEILTSRGRLVAIKPVGMITLGEGTCMFRNQIRELLKEPETKPAGIILNFADINYIDSSGIGELVSSYTSICNNGVPCSVTNLTKKIRELLAITKLLSCYPVYSTQENAIKDFEKYGEFIRPRNNSPSPYMWN
jgi:anti-sigma B factor antagonist